MRKLLIMGVAFTGKRLAATCLKFPAPTTQHIGVDAWFPCNLTFTNTRMIGQLNSFPLELV